MLWNEHGNPISSTTSTSLCSLASGTPPRKESARSWLDRSRRFVAKALEELDGSPRSSAHAFLCRRCPAAGGGGTGVAFVDCMLALKNERINNVIFEIAGRPETGKTLTLLALAASYLVQTGNRPNNISYGGDPNRLWPPVIILDTDYGIHMPYIVNALQSAILLQKSQTRDQCQVQSTMELEISFHLGRIHLVPLPSKEDIPFLLELLRPMLLSHSVFDAPPMLIIDAINSFESCDKIQPDGGIPSTHEFMRQLDRLIQACQQDILIFASRIVSSNASAATSDLWKRRVTHSVTLERRNYSTNNDFVAIFPTTTNQPSIPFRIESGRIVAS